VRNHAKLAYDAVAAWLEGDASPPDALAAVPGLDENLRWQDAAAQRLRAVRHEQGALDLETIEARAVFVGEEIRDLQQQAKNRARELIEDLMIAVNGVTARFLDAHGLPSLRRVLRSPERWERIVDVAGDLGERLPAEPDCSALEAFLRRRKRVDPLRFPDLSLTIVKLMGSGEYAVDVPGREPIGHFGLAVRDYTHSTAPNRRYPDVITQRMLKAALAEAPPAYSLTELGDLASHCTEQEDDVQRIERQVRKSLRRCCWKAATASASGIVTGASEKGTWVRLRRPSRAGWAARLGRPRRRRPRGSETPRHRRRARLHRLRARCALRRGSRQNRHHGRAGDGAARQVGCSSRGAHSPNRCLACTHPSGSSGQV
jgi:exoribonuclease-2